MTPILICVIIAGSVAALVYSHIRARGVTNATWDDLLARLQPLFIEGIAMVAFDRHPSATSREPKFEQEEIWNLLGGLDGLKRMKQNAEVMIALAAYAEHRNHHKRMIIAERMRNDGLVLRRAVREVRTARMLHLGAAVISTHLRDAARSYDQMRQRLPALYELSHGPQFSFS